MDKKLVLDFADHEGKRYTFAKINYLNHLKRHPELGEANYLKAITELILNCEPDLIYPSYNKKYRYVYYECLATVNGKGWYNCAVVQKTRNGYSIITAYRFCGSIREKKYGGPVCQRP